MKIPAKSKDIIENKWTMSSFLEDLADAVAFSKASSTENSRHWWTKSPSEIIQLQTNQSKRAIGKRRWQCQ